MNTRKDLEVIGKIVDRAIVLGINNHHDKLSLFMDIDFANDDIPIDLDTLLVADDFNFVHDVVGIQNNFNRVTKTMDNCFLPRYAI